MVGCALSNILKTIVVCLYMFLSPLITAVLRPKLIFTEASLDILEVVCSKSLVSRIFTAQCGCLTDTGRHIVPSDFTADGDCFIQVCSDHKRFLANTNFATKKWHRLILSPTSISRCWIQTEHIATSHQWHRLFGRNWSLLSTPVDSDSASFTDRSCLRLVFSLTNSKIALPARRFVHNGHRHELQPTLARWSASQGNAQDPG